MPIVTCIKKMSIAEEMASSGDDDLSFGPHVQELQLDVDDFTSNQSVNSPA